MKAWRRRLAWWLGATVLLLAIHLGAAHFLMDADVLRSMLAGFRPSVLAALVLLLAARSMLVFVMPGWALYLAATAVAQAWRAATCSR
jgi:hypothetical protein